MMIFLVRILEENEPLYILDDKILLKIMLQKWHVRIWTVMKWLSSEANGGGGVTSSTPLKLGAWNGVKFLTNWAYLIFASRTLLFGVDSLGKFACVPADIRRVQRGSVRSGCPGWLSWRLHAAVRDGSPVHGRFLVWLVNRLRCLLQWDEYSYRIGQTLPLATPRSQPFWIPTPLQIC